MNAMLLSDRNNYLNDTKAYIIQMNLALFLLENCKISFSLSIKNFICGNLIKQACNFRYEYIQIKIET